MDPGTDILSGLSPEMLKQILEIGNFDAQHSGLQEQMAMANALRQPKEAGRHHLSSTAATFGALGDTINNVTGAVEMKQLKEQEKQLMDAQTTAKAAYYGLGHDNGGGWAPWTGHAPGAPPPGPGGQASPLPGPPPLQESEDMKVQRLLAQLMRDPTAGLSMPSQGPTFPGGT